VNQPSLHAAEKEVMETDFLEKLAISVPTAVHTLWKTA